MIKIDRSLIERARNLIALEFGSGCKLAQELSEVLQDTEEEEPEPDKEELRGEYWMESERNGD